MKIYQITEHTFQSEDDYKYVLSVEDDFTYIEYWEVNSEEKMEKKVSFAFPTDFAKVIAEQIVKDCKILEERAENKNNC